MTTPLLHIQWLPNITFSMKNYLKFCVGRLVPKEGLLQKEVFPSSFAEKLFMFARIRLVKLLYTALVMRATLLLFNLFGPYLLYSQNTRET